MDRALTCLLVNVKANTRSFKAIPIYKNEDKKIVQLHGHLFQLNQMTIMLLRDLIYEHDDTKLWKVNLDTADIENKKISTKDDIIKLGGKEMTPSDMLEVYIQDELNSLNFMPNKIHIIAIDYTTPTIARKYNMLPALYHILFISSYSHLFVTSTRILL